MKCTVIRSNDIAIRLNQGYTQEIVSYAQAQKDYPQEIVCYTQEQTFYPQVPRIFVRSSN